jgi:hypothetical protein
VVPLHTFSPVVLKQGHPGPPEPDCTGVPELQMYQSVVHWYEHVPLEQVWFLVNGRLLQFTAPDPQAQGLLSGGRHAPSQSDVPLGHAQAPFTQAVPDGQTVAHEPQLFGSLDNVTQAPLQAVWPVGHAQVPLTHVAPDGQTVAHEPQLFGRSTTSHRRRCRRSGPSGTPRRRRRCRTHLQTGRPSRTPRSSTDRW